jgi:hypothetical protein
LSARRRGLATSGRERGKEVRCLPAGIGSSALDD